ncbi:MAG: hypothetical protein ABI742_11670 [Gemmatimonadota bacterium]
MSVMLVLLLGAFLVWLLVPGRRPPATDGDAVEAVDADELEAAEREVRDLGVDQRPEDGFEGDDWGPGAGTQRRGRD